MTIGNVIGGKLADWKLMPTVIATLGAVFFTHALFAEVSGMAVAAIAVVFLWGVLTFVIVPPLQMRVVETASEAPNLAATLNQGAFNVGNASGAWIGGLALTWGVSYQNLPFVGALLALIGLGVAVWSHVLDRKAQRRQFNSSEGERLSLEPLAGL
jgi:DHA1 family inner membrane transport protein